MMYERKHETYRNPEVDWAMMFAQLVSTFEHSGVLKVFEDSSIEDIHDAFDDCLYKFNNDPEVIKNYNYFHDYAIDYILQLQHEYDNKNEEGGGVN